MGQLGNNTQANSRTPTAVTGSSGASDISSGGDHTCVLIDGMAKCWGSNFYGQIGNRQSVGVGQYALTPQIVRDSGNNIIRNFTQIVSKSRFSCAIVRDNGSVMCWG